ncbi:hypothetical protein UFOVP22_42 [uncultured Caudovirales phage]|uniref:Uncharacterized protein n=1 Tax=uncultured Caudovirales phage TaxID=2100421 RepID=A0A6J5T833_9CAUD|nr:hypothetical protein UFOVP22_42 [uncultured Caudovirales phage]
MLTNVPTRFFTSCLYGGSLNFCEISQIQFQALQGVITYDRHTMSTNGVNQVCLTKECREIPLYEELDII